MRFLGSKKADANEMILLTIRDLTLIIIIFVAIFGFINNAAEQRTFERRFLAKDTALLINTVYVAPGNLNITNPQNTQGFVIEVTGNKVEVYDLKGSKKPPATEIGTYFFMVNKDTIPKYAKLIPKIIPTKDSKLKDKQPNYYKIKILKTGDDVALSQAENEE